MSRFDTTRWSLVLQARAEEPVARSALETLCRAYRPPVLAYVRSRGYTPDRAEDLVQGFLCDSSIIPGMPVPIANAGASARFS